MSENYKSYRIRTEVGQTAPNVINVHLEQTYDQLEILSLKLDQKNTYQLLQSDKGVVVGRVLANGGVGIPNAKVSVFIETDDTMSLEKHLLYPYHTVNDTDSERIRYNLLPDYLDEVCHQNVGTFPNKRLVLDNNDILDIYDKFWKYTTVTNSSGDYMLYGIPSGNQMLHMDVDLSDIGILSVRPYDMIYKGYNINQFENPNKFKTDTNLDALSQIKSQNKGIYVYPFWGDTTNDESDIAVTRCDMLVDYKFEPTCIFMGSIVTDTWANAIDKNCAGTENVGRMQDLVTGEGSIEMIRKTIDGRVEEFPIKGNRVIDGNGVWCYQIPMNLDYVMTDEFGNLVPTDNPEKGIPTRTRVRFRISLQEMPNDRTARKRCRYLVPNNPRFESDKFPEFCSPESTHEPDYEFGTATKDESYCDLFWNKVYTVKNYIPRLQKNSKAKNKKHTGIKLVNHHGDNNPMPYNNLMIKLSFTYRLICLLTKLFIYLITFLNNLLTLIAVVPCLLAYIFKKIANLFYEMRIRIRAFGKTLINLCLGCPIGDIFNTFASLFEKITPSCISISSEFCEGEVTHAYTYYPGCGRFLGVNLSWLSCVWDETQQRHNNNQVNGVEVEDRTSATREAAELFNCVESSLAEDNDVTNFNFYNDWINGTLYAPLWYRKIVGKRKYFFGLFKRRAKDEWCSADHFYGGKLRMMQTCAVPYSTSSMPDAKAYTNFNGDMVEPYIMNKEYGECGDGCQERRETIGMNYGVIRTKETMLGDTVYYYKPFEFESGADYKDGAYEGGRIKLLFATDIVLLGSLNDCDLDGVPQFFKALESTTYKMPPNMLASDNTITYELDKDGKMVTKFDQISVSEMTGNDWGNSNDDICGKPDGGLFYSIGCSDIDIIPKSCINLIRICEYGVSLDETKAIPDWTKPITDPLTPDEDIYDTLVPDGYISRDELFNDDERSMFATMNGNGLRTVLNKTNGLREYDFRHFYVDGFDKSLYADMYNKQYRNTKCRDKYTYTRNYKFEKFSKAYYDFRMGRKPLFYTDIEGNKFVPRYENSFYFYFGLKDGKTAIDKFNSEFFSECYNADESMSPIGLSYEGSSWCNGKEGYIALDLTKIDKPCNITIKNPSEDKTYTLADCEDEKIYFAFEDKTNFSKYTRKWFDDGQEFVDENGHYTLEIVTSSGEVIDEEFDLTWPYLKFETEVKRFNLDEEALNEKFPADSYPTEWDRMASIMVNGEGKKEAGFDTSRAIGGTIAVYNVVDSKTGKPLQHFLIILTKNGFPTPTTPSQYTCYNSVEVDGLGIEPPCKNLIYHEGATDTKSAVVVFGVDEGDWEYTVEVREICDGHEIKNHSIRNLIVNYPQKFKMYINGLDYDVISDWNTGWKPRSFNSTSFPERSGMLSTGWLYMSRPQYYKWEKLKEYLDTVDYINEILEKYDKAPFDKKSSGVNAIYEGSNGYSVMETKINTLTDGDDKEKAKSLLEQILTIEAEFIKQMKATFWLTCPNERKVITLSGDSDFRPLKFYTYYREEEAGDDPDYNTLAENKMTVRPELNGHTASQEEDKNELTQFYDIKIPTLTSSENKRYYQDGSMAPIVGRDVYYAVDVESKLRDKNKYPYFVAVEDSVRHNDWNYAQTGDENTWLPNLNHTVNPPQSYFGFHMLDKMFNFSYMMWAAVENRPYFYPENHDYYGKMLNISGILAAKVMNGVAISYSNKRYNSETGEWEDFIDDNINNNHYAKFVRQTIGRDKLMIYTKRDGNKTDSEIEDNMPTTRAVLSANDGDYTGYYVIDLENEFVDGKFQYFPLKYDSVNLTITDANYCSYYEPIYGDLEVELNEESVNDCTDQNKSVLSVGLSGNINGTIRYYAVGFGRTKKNLAYEDYASRAYYPYNDKIPENDNKIKVGKEPNFVNNYIFAYDIDEERLKGLVYTDLRSNMAGETDDTHGYGDTGTFIATTNKTFEREALYVVAFTDSGCRAMSPVYEYPHPLYGEVRLSVARSMTIESDVVIGVEQTVVVSDVTYTFDVERHEVVNGEREDGKIGIRVDYERANITRCKVYDSLNDVTIVNPQPYYFTYHSYDLNVAMTIDSENSLEFGGTVKPVILDSIPDGGTPAKYQKVNNIYYLLKDDEPVRMYRGYYEYIVPAEVITIASTDYALNNIRRSSEFIAYDAVGLKHKFKGLSSTPKILNYLVVNFELNGGQWPQLGMYYYVGDEKRSEYAPPYEITETEYAALPDNTRYRRVDSTGSSITEEIYDVLPKDQQIEWYEIPGKNKYEPYENDESGYHYALYTKPSASATGKYIVPTSPVTSSVPTKRGYEFVGWSANKYYDLTLDGPKPTVPSPSLSWPVGYTIIAPKEKWLFTNDELPTEYSKPQTWYAVWKAVGHLTDRYVLWFDYVNGEGYITYTKYDIKEVIDEETGEGTGEEIPTYIQANDVPIRPEKTGYILEWENPDGQKYKINTDDPSEIPLITDYKVTADTLFKAAYIPRQYEVKWMNGSTQIGETQKVNYNELAVKPSTDPTQAGKEFVGWDPAPSTPITRDTTFNAIFMSPGQTLVTATYKDGTTVLGTALCISGENPIGVPQAPQHEGEEFTGWNPSINVPITGDTTYVAQYTPNPAP